MTWPPITTYRGDVILSEAKDLRMRWRPPPTGLIGNAVLVRPLNQDRLIAGQPVVTMTITTAAHREQINARLFDVRPDGTKDLVTRGTMTIDTGDPLVPIGTRSVKLTTYGNLWQAHAGDTLRLEITNVDSPYIEPSKIPSVTAVSGVTLRLPIR